jgi:catechol 2,3-dioxygenase-like lactoylglutathione lyase family enzyme
VTSLRQTLSEYDWANTIQEQSMSDIAFAKINFRVKDLDAAVAFARDVLGATVLRERTTISFGEMAMVQLGGLVMEIIAPGSPDSPLARLIDNRGEGVDSVGFSVPDVHAASAELEAAGARMTGSQGADPESIAWMHPKNPLGLSLELLQRDFWAEAPTRK